MFKAALNTDIKNSHAQARPQQELVDPGNDLPQPGAAGCTVCA
jgi:hypothetical protein